MAYIGKQPLVGNYTVLDSLTATTTDTYALTKNSVAVFPQTPANCIVSLNGVIQAPFDSYTISGSNIVFASALTASDSIDFITVLGDVLNVGTVSDGTIGIAKLSATGTPSSSTFLRGDNSWVSAGGTMTPVWSVSLSATQNISDSTYTKVNFDSVFVDTDSAYDNTTNYRWTCPSGKGGKYFIYSSIHLQSGSNSNWIMGWSQIRKNGTAISNSIIDPRGSVGRQYNSTKTIIENLSAGDYLECWGYVVSGSGAGQGFGGGNSGEDLFKTTFGGYKIIE